MAARAEDILQENPERTAGIALRAFFKIADAWKLTAPQMMTLLGFAPSARSTFYKWKTNPESARLNRDRLERISYILGIYKALHILLPDPALADDWVNRPNTNPLFGGQSALDRMLSGNVGDLYIVREYLDGERGW